MWYGYPYEDHGDPSVDERWRRTFNQQASQAGFPLVSVPERIQTPRRAPLVSVDELLADILTRGA